MNSGDAEELLRARGVPDLCTDALVAVRQRHRPELELHSIGRLRLLLEESFRNSQHEVGLADGLVTNDNNLVEVIETLLRVIEGPTVLVSHFLLQAKVAGVGADLQQLPLRLGVSLPATDHLDAALLGEALLILLLYLLTILSLLGLTVLALLLPARRPYRIDLISVLVWAHVGLLCLLRDRPLL